MKKLLSAFVITLELVSAAAQRPETGRMKMVPPQTQTVVIDSLPLVPGSLVMKEKNGGIFSEENYRTNSSEAKIFFTKIPQDTLYADYRIFPGHVRDTFLIYEKPREKKIIPPGNKKSKTTNHSASANYPSGIQTGGSIARGLSVGNKNDASLNSEMSLQLSGELMPGTQISAALSDDNLPVQAEGTTQQLKEFDRVFIEIKNKRNRLTAGDIVSRSDRSTFIKSRKKAQGLNYQFTREDSSLNISSSVTLGVSKGQYRRIKFNGREGDQGPYRLTGNNKENFIIILSDSERIFVNGELLTRGQEHDYTINYNTAELRFTANFPIDKNSRIIAEYEYSDRNYTRFLSSTEAVAENQSGQFFFSFLSEKDAKNQSIAQDLSPEQKEILMHAGDSLQNAVIPSATLIDSLDENRIAYLLKDTTVNGNFYQSIYEYSPDPKPGQYYVSFSYKGKNKGNYIRKSENINGQVYEWTAPENGKPQGSYSPEKTLISPKSKHMAAIGADLHIGKKSHLSIEGVLSYSDINLFSNKNHKDNDGYAFKAKLNTKAAETSFGTINFRGRYMYTGQNFSVFENFRSPEFERNYNLSALSDSDFATRHISTQIDLSDNPRLKADISGNFLKAGSNYQAGKGGLKLKYENDRTAAGIDWDYLRGDIRNNQNQFLKYITFAELKLKALKIGLKNQGELNTFKSAEGQIRDNSFRFNELSVYSESLDSNPIYYLFEYTNREKFLPENNNLHFGSEAHTFSFKTTPLKQKYQTLNINSNYRVIKGYNTDSSATQIPTQLSGQLNYSLSALEQALGFSAFIEHMAGSRMMQEFEYLEVSAGNGYYAWHDFNDNGRREMDEFMPAKFPDEAKFIKMQLPGHSYQKVYNQKAELSFSLNPKRAWQQPRKIWQKALVLFSNRIIVQHDRAVDTQSEACNIHTADSLLFEQDKNIRNQLSFTGPRAKFKGDYIIKINESRNRQINGVAGQNLHSRRLKLRYLKNPIVLQAELRTSLTERRNDIAVSANYAIETKTLSFSPAFTGLKNSETRALFKADQKYLQDKSSNLNSYHISFTQIIKKFGQSSFSCEISYIKNKLNGNENTAAAYEMMDGLKNGNNFTWELNLQTKLSDYLQLNLMYSGRKSEHDSAIHTGNLSIRALF